jgi:iron complex transport system ATP-binding protein
MRYVELRGLSIGYSGHVVAEGLAARLRAGELTCLIGRNGTGKSTLLKTVAGLLPPISGDIVVVDDGRESLLLTQRDIAVVLTERINIQGMRVRDMVGLGRSPYTGFFGVLRERDNEIVTEAMKLAGLPPEQYAHRLINEISDGEKQKAMIAKAIAQQTPVILLDEPTAFLDYPSKEETMLMLRSLALEQGKAILISTHDLDVAQRTTDAAWFFNNGAIEELSDPRSMTKIFR